MLNNIKKLINEQRAMLEAANLIAEETSLDNLDDLIVLGESSEEEPASEEPENTDPDEFEEDGDEGEEPKDDDDDEEEKDDEEDESSEKDRDVMDQDIEAEPEEDTPEEPESDDPMNTDMDTDLGSDVPPTDKGMPEVIGAQTGEPVTMNVEDILTTEIDLTTNTPKDTLPIPPAGAVDAVGDTGDDSILNQRIDSGFENPTPNEELPADDVSVDASTDNPMDADIDSDIPESPSTDEVPEDGDPMNTDMDTELPETEEANELDDEGDSDVLSEAKSPASAELDKVVGTLWDLQKKINKDVKSSIKSSIKEYNKGVRWQNRLSRGSVSVGIGSKSDKLGIFFKKTKVKKYLEDESTKNEYLKNIALWAEFRFDIGDQADGKIKDETANVVYSTLNNGLKKYIDEKIIKIDKNDISESAKGSKTILVSTTGDIGGSTSYGHEIEQYTLIIIAKIQISTEYAFKGVNTEILENAQLGDVLEYIESKIQDFEESMKADIGNMDMDFVEAITIGDDNGGNDDNSGDGDNSGSDNEDENDVTSAVRSKVAEAGGSEDSEDNSGDDSGNEDNSEGSEDEGLGDEGLEGLDDFDDGGEDTSGDGVDKDSKSEIADELSKLSKSVEDIKNRIIQNML